MAAPSVPCSKCNAPLSADLFDATHTAYCSGCGVWLTAYLFPALGRATMEFQAPQALAAEAEASCFFHPSKRAVVACGACGRFLCGLCDLEWEGGHLCSSCLEAGKKKGKIKTLENHRLLYDHVALSLSLLPLLMWPVTCLTAPMVLYLCVRYWYAPRSLTSRTRIWFVLAGMFSLAEIAGWVWLIAVVFHLASK